MKDIRNFLSALAWLTGLLIAQVALHELGQSTYALPALNQDALRSWVTDTDLTTVVLSVVRVVAVLAIWYVLVTTVACAIAQRSLWRRAAAIIDRITLPGTRALAIRLASVSAIGGLAMPVAAANATTAHETPTLYHLTPNEQLPSTTTTVISLPPRTTATVDMIATSSIQQHTVRRGENFWTIAHDALTTSLRREPSENEVTEYWRVLIRTNQQRLAHPDNPDLLFAGQIIDLPTDL